MLRRIRMLGSLISTCVDVKQGQQVLIVADDRSLSVKMAQQVAEACDMAGAEVVMAIMSPRKRTGQEPPSSIGAAMQVCHTCIQACEPTLTHTNAGKAAREKGVKFVSLVLRGGEEFFDREISVADLKAIKERSEHIAGIVSRANVARVTSSLGTDLSMSLKGRKGLAIHPMGGADITTLPDYAEVAVSPVEGSTEGILVADGGMRGWDLPLREPLRLSIKQGRVAAVSGPEDYVERTQKLLATDENASNCAAELGIGTTHTMTRSMLWTGVVLGTIHIAVGRNNDIGGETYSRIHNDLNIFKPTLWLDDVCLIEDGEMKISQHVSKSGTEATQRAVKT